MPHLILEQISLMLEQARKYGLEAEVVMTLITEIHNPCLTDEDIVEACQFALLEWDI